MFIYSVRASTVKFFAFILLTLALVVGAVLLGGESVAASGSGEITYGGIKTAEDRVSFIEGFGLEVEDEPIECEQFRMPESFDRVILGYNELQKKQGLDLSKYARKRVVRYVYRVTNYESEGEVYATLFIYRNKIIACDISSADPNGFVLPLTQVEEGKLK